MHTHTHTRMHTRTHVHTHTHYSVNWVLILVGAEYCKKRKVFSLALKDDRVELCLRSCENSKCGVQSKRKCETHETCVCIVGILACGCRKKSVVYETECRHVAI